MPAPIMLRKLKRAVILGFVALLVAAAVVYAGDYGLFRVRVARNWNPYGSVVVTHYYAVLQKNGKTSFMFDPPGPQSCANALFPQAGAVPCWYLSRHPEVRTDI